MNTMNAKADVNPENRVIRNDSFAPTKRRNNIPAFFYAASFVLTVGGSILKIIAKGILFSGRLLKPRRRSRL